MADVRISQLPQAPAITGSERVPLVQEVGQPIAPAALTVGLAYKIVSLGTTNWAAIGAGASPAAGLVFVATATGGGTGLVIRVETRTATTAEIAARAPGADLAWVSSTLKITSSTGDDAQLTLATATDPGLISPTDQAFVDSLQDGSGNITLAGLSVTGTATLDHIHGNIAGLVYQHARNSAGISLAALTPTRITGSQGDTDRVTVVAARADDPALMPASGLLATALANNQDGHGAVVGVIQGVNTSGLTSGQQLYVSPTGGLTPTMPAERIQPIAIVGRVHASTGTLIVLPGPVLSRVAFTGAYGDLASRAPEITQADAEAGTSTTFSLWSPLRWRQAAAAWWLTVTGAFGRSLAAASTAAQGRAALELGTAAQAATGDFATAAQGTLASQAVSGTTARAANVFLAGPASGSSAAPTFRAMEAADLPATAVSAGSYGSAGSVGRFTVDAAGRLTFAESVAISITAGQVSGLGSAALASAGDFATSAQGTLASQAVSGTTARAANLILSGPASGSSAAPTFRAMVPADLPSSAAFTGTFRVPLSRPAAPDQLPAQLYLESGVLYHRDNTGATGTEQRLLTASGNLQNISNPSLALANLFFGGTGVPIIANGAVGYTNSGTGASVVISGSGSSGTSPGVNFVTTGTTATGGAGISLFLGPVWTSASGKHTLQSFNRLRLSMLLTIDTLSDATNTFVAYVGGYTDHVAGFSTRSSFGALIVGNTVYAAATAGGVETLSSSTATINAGQLYKYDIDYDGTTLSVKVNNGTALTITTGFPASTVPLGWGCFIIKTNGTTARNVRASNPALMLAQTALP